MTLNPDHYECPEHRTDLTRLVEQALEDQGHTGRLSPSPAGKTVVGKPPVSGDRQLPWPETTRHRIRLRAPGPRRNDCSQSGRPVRPTRHGPTSPPGLRQPPRLERVDAVTARAVTTITVIGVLLTGLGALSAGQLSPAAAPPGAWPSPR